MRIKFNWGTGIFITIIVMISWLGFLVSKAFDYKINIDSDDYYERGLVHSIQMERIQRSLLYKNDFSVIQNGEFVTIKYPAYFEDKNMSGELWFYRPSDYELDKKITALNQNKNTQDIHNQHFTKGRFLVRATLQVDSLSYFFEQEIIIR